jgi:RNA polymerase sigma factor (sigma-70 family)
MTQGTLQTLVRRLHRIASEPEGPSDRQLLQHFATTNDQTAFAVLVRRYGGLVLGVCECVLHHAADAEDAFQATFLVLARKAASLPWRESVGGWLHEVAHRIALKAKAERLRRQAQERRQATMLSPKTPPDPGSRELCAALDEELRRLPDDCRAPLLLCYLEGLTRDEAARRLGWSTRTLKRRLARGLALLRSRLQRRGLSLSSALLVSALSQKSAGAAVPAALVESVTRALAEGARAPVISLAEAVLAGTGAGWGKVGLSLLVVLSVLIGCRLSAFGNRPAEEAKQTTADRRTTATESRPQKTDLHGDPLPQGALARLGTVRLRHGYTVAGVAFSPDRKTLASAGQDNTIRLWDMATGKQVRRFTAITGLGAEHAWVIALAFSPDGKRILGGTANGSTHLILWETATGKELWRLQEKQRAIGSVAFAPDGKAVASSDASGEIVLWDAETGEKLRECKGHDQWVESIAFSVDGKLLASACRDGTARLWDPATGQELQRIKRGSHQMSVALSPDNRLLAVGGWQSGIGIFDTAGGKEVSAWKGHVSAVSTLAFLGDGRTLASGSWDRTIRLWDVKTGKRLRLFEGHQGPVPGIAVSPDDKLLASGSWDGTVRLWDLATGKEVLSQPGHQQKLWSIALSADGKTVATGADDGTVRLWDADTGKELRRLEGYGGIVDRLSFSPDGKVLTSGSYDHTLRRWDVVTGKKLVEHNYGALGLSLSADGKRVAGSLIEGGVVVWDRATGREIRKVKGQERSASAVLSPDGKTLAAGSEAQDGTVILWDVDTGKEVRRLQGDPHIAYKLAFSPDGRYLGGAMANNRVYVPAPVIHLWDVATGKELRQFKGHQGGVTGLRFSADSRTLASSGDRTARLWEVATGQVRRVFRGHEGTAWGVALSRDGRRLASGSFDTTALLWDVTGLAGVRPENVTEKDLESRWSSLAGTDAAKAFDAIWWQAAVPRESVPFLAKRLRPVVAPDPQRAARLVADLDSKAFATRKKAAEELEQMGEGAIAALRMALEGKPAVETRRRVEDLLEKLTGLSPDRLRVVRAIETLEAIGTREALTVLEKLAAGLAGARTTEEAGAASQRLTRRLSER